MTFRPRGSATLLRGDALHLPLASESVALAITSPPYWTFRSYRDGDEHYEGQLGSEPNPWLFLVHLWQAMDEIYRVLRPDGSAWINLGDKSSGSGGGNDQSGLTNDGATNYAYRYCEACERSFMRTQCPRCGRSLPLPAEYAKRKPVDKHGAPRNYESHTGDLQPKSRMILPHRFAFGCVDPEYRALEERRAGVPVNYLAPQWTCRADVVWSKRQGIPESTKDRVRMSHEYWFHFTKRTDYYANLDPIRQRHKNWIEGPRNGENIRAMQEDGSRKWNVDELAFNPNGRTPSSVWELTSEPFRAPPGYPRHSASFPSELPRRMILGWSPPSSIVLDPFAGTGTTVAVASVLGRHGVGVELSTDYLAIARWRIREPGIRAKVRAATYGNGG